MPKPAQPIPPTPSPIAIVRVLSVTSEAVPMIKTGGLADVSGALPAALGTIGVDVRVLLPGYPAALDGAEGKRQVANLGDPLGIGADAKLTLPYFDKQSYLQINVQNLFNKNYISRATTNPFVSFTPPGLTAQSNTEFYYTGAPSTIYMTLGARF